MNNASAKRVLVKKVFLTNLCGTVALSTKPDYNFKLLCNYSSAIVSQNGGEISHTHTHTIGDWPDLRLNQTGDRKQHVRKQNESESFKINAFNAFYLENNHLFEFPIPVKALSTRAISGIERVIRQHYRRMNKRSWSNTVQQSYWIWKF